MGKMKGISVHTKPCCVHHTHMALTPSPSYSSLETKQDIIHSEDFSGRNLIYKEHVHYGGGICALRSFTTELVTSEQRGGESQILLCSGQ